MEYLQYRNVQADIVHIIIAGFMLSVAEIDVSLFGSLSISREQPTNVVMDSFLDLYGRTIPGHHPP